MRSPRAVIIVAFFITVLFLTFLSLRSSHPPKTATVASPAHKTRLQSFFSFRAPFSLFPPNAIITLTHENSTAFLARPAAFGPSLPQEGLSGQLWIGSGFGDDSIREGTAAAGAVGELGCSDVPGWVDDYAKKPGTAKSDGVKSGVDKSATTAAKSRKRGSDGDGPFDDRTATSEDSPRKKKDGSEPSIDDGTDDYLHHPLPGSRVSKPTDPQPADANGNHADIQSIQEGAEIAGKIVLLSRGGCGFLEKVKWAQRRGAISLIVGDDTKGGPLIQMYARGDTSNVTIPSIFTSRTTAHLLSSLVGSGNFIEDSVDEKGNPTLKVLHTDKPKKAGKNPNLKPTFTQTTTTTKATSTSRPASKAPKKGSTPTKKESTVMTTERPGWFKSLFFGSKKGNSETDSSRPPSSGQLDWVLVDDWKDDDSTNTEKVSSAKSKQNTDTGAKNTKTGDDFVIGVQDWRDPDLVGSSSSKDSEKGNAAEKSDTTKMRNTNSHPAKSGKKHIGGALQDIPEYIPKLRGGSTTPGSGEYSAEIESESEKPNTQGEQKDSANEGKSKGLLTAIFGDDEEDIEFIPTGSSSTTHNVAEAASEDKDNDNDGEYDGLWVTLTPTNGASPFLDTLLVLVVSPLVTLTVVYALLLVRSRIRRRRWRAPKSVVDRLPVRTYQTITTPGHQSPRLPSPTSTSATTPLLQQSPSARPRPRSRTTTGIPEHGGPVQANSSPLQMPSSPARSQEHEKSSNVSPEWKRYMGKQVECVVCLEEYIDGVSQVMSLPCGHEFHVNCITPWLTTRRRTCPICKGDVVRSLARGSSSSPRYEPYIDDSDDDGQAQASETANESSSSGILGDVSDENNGDLEQGTASSDSSRRGGADPSVSWRSLLTSSLGSTSRRPHSSQEERSR